MNILLRVRWGIHAVWLIAILLGVIAFLFLKLPDGDRVADYISFAASLSSLILAVVAIFYSMIANDTSSSAIGALQRTAENIEAAAQNISNTSGDLSAYSSGLMDEIAALSPTVRGIAEKVEKLSPTAAVDKVKPTKITSSLKEAISFGNLTSGQLISLYAIAMSFEKDQGFTPAIAFPAKNNWEEYTLGFLNSVSLFGSYGIKIDKSLVEKAPSFKVVSLGQLNLDDLKKRVHDSTLSSVIIVRKEVESYFIDLDIDIDGIDQSKD